MKLIEANNMSSTNSVKEIYEYKVNSYEKLFLELFTFVGLISVLANVLIIFVILKFKKLVQDVTNVIIVHLSVLEALYLLITPLSLRAGIFFTSDYAIQKTVTCIFYENEFVLTVAMCLFLYLLLSDWYLKTYNERKYAIFRKIWKFFVAGIYMCSVFLCTVATLLCFQGLMLVATLLIMLVCYIVLIILLIVMNTVHFIRKSRLRENKHNVGLFIANTFVVIWIPAIVVILLVCFMIRFPPEIAIIAFTLGFSSPIFNLWYLFYKVDTFNVSLRKIFRRQCNEYVDGLLENQTIVYSKTSGVKIDKN